MPRGKNSKTSIDNMSEHTHRLEGCDSASLQTGSQLRAMGGAELARLGDESLRAHLVDMAMVANQSYAPFRDGLLTKLMDDRNVVRYPVKLVFEMGSLAAHQFAQPEPNGQGFTLYLHPELKSRPDDVIRALAYFIPVMNFGELINDDHCLLYGATLVGTTVDDYFKQLCRLADDIGAPAQDRGAIDSRF